MPRVISLAFDVNMTVERFIWYDSHNEDPKDIMDLLFVESTEEERNRFINELVVEDFSSVPGCYEITAELATSPHDIHTFRDDPYDPCEPAPRHWTCYVDPAWHDRNEKLKLRQQLYEALEDASYNNEFDRIIELATQLKNLNIND